MVHGLDNRVHVVSQPKGKGGNPSAPWKPPFQGWAGKGAVPNTWKQNGAGDSNEEGEEQGDGLTEEEKQKLAKDVKKCKKGMASAQKLMELAVEEENGFLGNMLGDLQAMHDG